jgi:hypothetical protein
MYITNKQNETARAINVSFFSFSCLSDSVFPSSNCNANDTITTKRDKLLASLEKGEISHKSSQAPLCGQLNETQFFWQKLEPAV